MGNEVRLGKIFPEVDRLNNTDRVIVEYRLINYAEHVH